MNAALTENVRKDGTVEGHRVETHYRECKSIYTDSTLGALRVTADDGFTDIETRVLFATLIADGWAPPTEVAALRLLHAALLAALRLANNHAALMADERTQVAAAIKNAEAQP